MTTKTSGLGDILRSASGLGGGAGASNVPQILAKMGTFARAVATEKYGIDQGFAFDSGLIFPLIGINHLVTRGIFQPLERSISGASDPEAGAAASGTADVALKDTDKFFENAENHFSPAVLEALKKCMTISASITGAEKSEQNVTISASDLQNAELALRGIKDAVAKIANDNPGVAGVAAFAKDMATISTHYSALSQKLLPTLSSAPKADKKG